MQNLSQKAQIVVEMSELKINISTKILLKIGAVQTGQKDFGKIDKR